MTNEYEFLNLNMVLKPISAPIDKGTPFKSGFDFDTQMDREFINQVALRTDSVSTRTIQDLAVTDAKILNLTANKITAGTIDASSIAVINLDADNITTGSIDASEISVYNLSASNITTGALDASYIDADTLSAISADMGTVTAGVITGNTITGGTVRTAASGSRVEMVSSDNELRVYNSTTKIIQVDEGGMWVRGGNVIGLGGGSAPAQTCQIYEHAEVSGALEINADSAIDLNALVYAPSGMVISSSLSMNGSDITSIDELKGDDGYIDMNSGNSNTQTHHLDPSSSGNYNLGGADRYWDYVNCVDVSYHSIGYYNEGMTVEIDGKTKKVTNVEAVTLMRPHSKLKDKNGAPLLDKKSLPKEIFIPAQNHNGVLYERDENDLPIITSMEYVLDNDGNYIYTEDGKRKTEEKTRIDETADGESGAQLIALLLGAVKELNARLEVLESK